MTGLLETQYAEPSSTGVAHENIDGLLAENKRQYQESQYDLHGTIGPTPFMETDEGQQTLLDMVTGSPGGAIGRVAKGAVTGGHKAIGKNLAAWVNKKLGRGPSGKMSSEEAGNKLKNYFDEMMDNAKKPKRKPQQPYEFEEEEAINHLRNVKNQYAWDNKLNASRIALEKAYNKFDLPHGQTVNDPITEILRASKYRRN